LGLAFAFGFCHRKIVCAFGMVERRTFDVESGVAPLKAIREMFGMTQPQFAVWLNVSPSTVSRWENGHAEPAFTIQQYLLLAGELSKHGYKLEDLPTRLGLAGQ
jgi:DNA-binding XRE family transcriptional regulator